MKKVTFLILIFLFIVFSTCFAMYKANSSLVLKEEDFKIANIYLGQPISNALSILGKPKEIKKGNANNYLDEYYYFSGIMIATSKHYQKKVSYILITNENITTARNIKIGDSEKEVIKKYGKPVKANNILIYEKEYDPFFNYAIDFIMNKGKVEKIIIAFITTD